MKIVFNSLDGFTTEYTRLIEQFTKFEMKIEINTNEEKTLYLTNLFINTRNVRQGPRPTIEQQAVIIQTIRYYIHENESIPVLIPSGPKKTKDGESVDLAELSVIKILKCLNDAAKKVYAPGFSFHIRLEDWTGKYLEGENALFSMNKYIEDFQTLNRLIGDPAISFFTESKLTPWSNFEEVANKMSAHIQDYLIESQNIPEEERATLDSFSILAGLGWKGIIPQPMREYLINKYAKLYPEYKNTPDFYTKMMAKYLGATFAGHILKVRTPWSNNHKHLEIGFALPTPGIPENMQSTRVYYRSITLNNSKHNIPYWRAKGILKINENDDIRISLLSWNDLPSSNNISKGELVFTEDIVYKTAVTENPLTVRVKADIIFES